MAKMDKEALKKNLFWILLGVFCVLWIGAVVVVKMAADDKKKKDWEGAKGGIEGALSKGPKTEAYLKPWQEHGQKFRNHKDVIWKQAWDQQRDMYTWPESMPVSVRPEYPGDSFASPRDAAGKGDPIVDQNNRSRFKTDWYYEQFGGLEQVVFPAEFLGGFYGVFPVQVWDRSATPTGEEIWLAQEDYWVRRELLYMIRQAMDSVALLKDVTPADKEKLPDGIVGRRLFRNANWELNLLFEKGRDGRSLIVSDQSTIKNVNRGERTQVLAHPKTNKGLPFRLIQNRSVAELRIAGEPLPFGASTALKQKYAVAPVDLGQPFQVEQVLDWEISPVRRIDALALGRHSHRTVTSGLKVNEALKKLEPVEEEAAPGGGPPGSPGSMPPGMMMPPGGSPGSGPPPGYGPPGMGSGMGSGAAALLDATRVNKINRQRYMALTPQCKHLPIGLRMIIDQSYIHDILSTVSNSRLRIQITQVTAHHARDVNRNALGAPGVPGATGPGGSPTGYPGAPGGSPSGYPGTAGGSPPPGYSGAPTAAPGSGPGPGGYQGMPGRSMPPGMMLPGRTFMPGMVNDGARGGPAETTSQFVDNARLVELSIYGIASLYERYPPRPAAETSPGAPPAAKP